MRKIEKALYILLVLLLFYSMLRLAFYFTYFKNSPIAAGGMLKIIYWGIRLDFTALFYLNFFFFLYHFFIHDLLSMRAGNVISIVLLGVLNIPLLAVNFIDLAYYRFNLRRSTVDLFLVISDSLSALGAFWAQYWYLFLIFVATMIGLMWIMMKIVRMKSGSTKSWRENYYILRNALPGIVFLLIMGLLARGVGNRPILPSTPLLYIPAQYLPLVSNSTITLFYSLLKRQTRLPVKNYFSDQELDTLFTIRRQYAHKLPFEKKNIVFFILESFSREYVDKTDPRVAKTPFLDSLMAESVVCTNAFANGRESNKGIVGLLAGIPPFLDEPFFYSNYNNNRLRGLGTILKEEGYSSNFFMGAAYDHFGFAKFLQMIGIDNYYSEKDYGRREHHDGNWGIYDHYFLPYAGRVMNEKQNPFLAVIFTISTHYPFKLPDTLKARFSIPGQHPTQNSISYLDYSLALFFEQIKQASWYKNSLFVFAADHNVAWHYREKAALYRNFEIPIFFHMPHSGVQKEISMPVQQFDIVPTILDLLHYGKPFMSFGYSIYDTVSQRVVVNNTHNVYQALDSSWLMGYDEREEKPVYFYNYRTDPELNNNLLADSSFPRKEATQLDKHLKAVLQRFNNSLIRDQLYVK